MVVCSFDRRNGSVYKLRSYLPLSDESVTLSVYSAITFLCTQDVLARLQVSSLEFEPPQSYQLASVNEETRQPDHILSVVGEMHRKVF